MKTVLTIGTLVFLACVLALGFFGAPHWVLWPTYAAAAAIIISSRFIDEEQREEEAP